MNNPNQTTNPNNDPNTFFRMEPRGQDVEFHKWVTDPKDERIDFYQKYCGWIEKREDVADKFMGEVIPNEKISYDINWYARVMNESGANTVFYKLKHLIGPLTLTSTAEAIDIFNVYNGMEFAIRTDLLDSITIGRDVYKRDAEGKVQYDDNTKLPVKIRILNPFEINPDYVPGISADFVSHFLITNASKGGFKFKQQTEQIQEQRLIKAGMDPRDSGGEGVFDKIKNVFPGSDKSGNR